MAGYQLGDTILKVDEIQELTSGAGLTLHEISITVADTENFVGLAVVGNDITNNPDTVTITTTTTGNSLTVDPNGAVGVDIRFDGAVHVENTGNTGIGVGVYSDIGATASASLLYVLADNVAFDQKLTQFVTDGTDYAAYYQCRSVAGGRLANFDQDVVSAAVPTILIDDENTNATWGSLVIQTKRIGLSIVKEAGTSNAINADVNSNALGLNIDKDTTDENTTLGSLDINQTSVVTDAATYTKSGRIARITSAVTETSGIITDTAIVLELVQSHADATGDVCTMTSSGSGNVVFEDHNDTGANPTHYIDRDGNNAADIYALKLDCDNAGAGVPGAIDVSSFAQDEPILLVVTDAVNTPGAMQGQIAVYHNGGIEYIYTYATGTVT